MLVTSLLSISALLLGTTLAQEPASFKTAPDRPSLILFGDSLSDNGYMPHYSNYSKYWGGRYANSYMWNEYSAKLLDLNLENYAIGGSTTDNDFVPAYGRTQLIPSVADTVKAFLANNTKASDFKKKNSIIAIDGGGNNLFGALSDIQSGKMNIFYFIDTMVQNQIDSIKSLLDAGYRKIYLLNLPSLTMAPAVAEYGTLITAMVGILTPLMNAAFLAKLGLLKLTNPSKASEVKFFNMQDLMDTTNSDMVLNALNITDTKNPCVVDHPDGSQTFCSNDNARYYYDSFHPSGRPHYLIGIAFANIVKNPSFPVSKWSLADIAKKYDIGSSDNENNILAKSA